MGVINPTLPTVGQPRGTEDVDTLNALQTIVNTINGGIDLDNLATAAKQSLLGAYRTIGVTSGLLGSGTAAGTYWFDESGTGWADNFATASPVVPALTPILAADHAAGGLTARYRVQLALMTNGTSPASNFTAGLWQTNAVGGAGAQGIDLTATVAGSTITSTAPAANAAVVVNSADFTLGVGDGIFALALATSALTAANSRVWFRMLLQVHNT